jgi:tetratricopeptide (TPR) repeat protein
VSRYYYLIFLIVAFSSGCSTKSPSLLQSNDRVLDSNLTAHFPEEDRLAIFALDAQNHGQFKAASTYYSKLYDITGKVTYATEAVKNAVVSKDYDTIKTILDKAEANNHHDTTLDSYLVAYYIDKKRFKEARTLTDKLIKENRTAKNLELSGLAYEGIGEREKALAFYEEAYQKEKSTYALLKMTDLIYLKMKQKQKAIRLLETDVTINGCSETICSRLIQFYTHTHDSDGIANILKKLYKKTGNRAFAEKLIQLYASKKSYNEAISFLKETKFDDLLLLDIYTSKKDYKSALKLANKLYEKSGNHILLARSAILEYESANNKNSKKLLQSISKKFDKVVDILKDPLYYNYYGYLLINHELDIDRGMELVKKALKIEPNSLFYIDSLAWGMYKKGNCQDAYKLLEPLSKKSDEKEILDHIKIIKKCIEGKKHTLQP